MAIDTLNKAARTKQITNEDKALGLRVAAAISLAKVDPDALYQLSLLLFDEKPDVPTSKPAYAKSEVRKAAAQKQKIAILRTLLKDPDVIILDEPTSALDEFGKKNLLEYLKTIKMQKIIIVISHDLDFLQGFDDIIHLELSAQ